MSKFKSRTLFLDRDGVINKRFIGDYVKHPDDFEFIDKVPEAIKIFSDIFSKIIVVTNQQGIGKGLMTHNDLAEIHQKMETGVREVGGRIDAVFYAPELAKERSFLRKPNIGMGLKAKKQFPEINFRESIIAGDSLSDMKFGKRLKMTTILVGDEPELAKEYPQIIDYYFPSLYNFAEYLRVSCI